MRGEEEEEKSGLQMNQKLSYSSSSSVLAFFFTHT
jgi:hypothetical protein